jgi:4-hydroxybenzoate polyprenyltransferase
MSTSTNKTTFRTSVQANLVNLAITIRPKQWIKNLLVYLPLIFTVNLSWGVSEGMPNLMPLVRDTSLTFVAFTLASSAIYIWNDVCDLASDGIHPRKKHRPLASGNLSVRLASFTAILLSIAALALGFFVTIWICTLVASYLIVMVFYSSHLKHLAILDVIVISSGYVLRAVSGAVAINAPASAWLYVVTGLGALFLGFGKRKSELNKLQPHGTAQGTETATEASYAQRSVLSTYTHELLNTLMSISASSLILAYMIYTFTAANLPDNNSMMGTIPFVIYGTFRYILIVSEPTSAEQPEEALLSDKPVVATAIGWILAVITIFLMFPREP